jgi:PAS domain S-box-containing protein
MKAKVNCLNIFFDTGGYSHGHHVNDKIADLFPALIFIYDAADGRLSYVNEKFKTYFGFGAGNDPVATPIPAHLIFGNDWDFIHRDISSLRLNDRKSLKWKLKGVDDVDVNMAVLAHESDGTASLILCIAQPTHKNVNKDIATINEIYTETEALLHFGSWAWEPDTDNVEWSAGIFSILGYEFNEVVPSVDLFIQHILPEYRDEMQKLLSDPVRHENGFEIEYEIRTKNDDLKFIQAKGKLVANPSGRVPRVVGILRDITASKNAQREQDRMLRELNRSNKELEEFAYVASHDLQEPLRKIAMFSERLKVRYGDAIEKDGQVFMDRILNSADNMKVLIDNLLEFSRANRSSQNFASIDLNDIIAEVQSDFELKIEETDAQILITSKLPKIEAVYSEMKQLFCNLISNGIKFRKQGVNPVITINAHKATKAEKIHYNLQVNQPYYVIDIKDNGIGFEQEYADAIFQVFQRLHGKSEYPGSGIGLAICKRIIDNHNGSINVISAPLQGATFTIALPQTQF